MRRIATLACVVWLMVVPVSAGPLYSLGLAHVLAGSAVTAYALGGGDHFEQPERTFPAWRYGLFGAALVTSGVMFMVQGRVHVEAAPSRVAVIMRWP